MCAKTTIFKEILLLPNCCSLRKYMCQCLFVTSNVIGETITDKVNINELYLIDGTAIRD